MLFCFHKIPSACTTCLMTLIIWKPSPLHFKDYHHISCWSLGLLWATKATISWPESQLFQKFSDGRREKQKKIQPMKGNLGSSLQAWASTFPPKVHLDVLFSAFQVSFQTVKQLRLGTQDPFGVSDHRKYHFVGCTKLQNPWDVEILHISYSVNMILAKQKCHQQ